MVSKKIFRSEWGMSRKKCQGNAKRSSLPERVNEAWGKGSVNCQMLPTEAQAVRAQEESKGRTYV